MLSFFAQNAIEDFFFGDESPSVFKRTQEGLFCWPASNENFPMTSTTHHPPQPPTDALQALSQLMGDVRRVLDHSGYEDLQAIEVQVPYPEVVLRGTVSRYFLKQLAQELVKRVPGVEVLRNEVVVVRKDV